MTRFGKSYGGTRRDPAPMQVHMAKVKVPLTAVIAAWVARRVWAGVVACVKHPLTMLFLALLLWLWHLDLEHGPLPILTTVALVLVVGGVWRWRWPESFTRHVAWRVRGVWRSRRVYRYYWQPAMVLTGLSVTINGEEHLPTITSVRSSATVDVVTLRMLPGQCVTDWAGVAARLAQTFGVLEVRVRSVPTNPRKVQLWARTSDPLTVPVQPFPIAEHPDFTALPVALSEDGLPYRLRLLGTHLLVVGETGSGKGSVLWSLLAALAPAIRDRWCEVWAIDPKGGMELAPGAQLFARFSYGDPDDDEAYEYDFARILEAAVLVMRRRQAALRGHTRLHSPSVLEPLIVIVVDELASLTAYVNDRDAKKRISAALSLLLSQGRAVGVTVIGAVQDPRKDVVPFRDLFPTRIALRLAEADQVGLVLGAGARDRGARCDEIPESLPGVGFVVLDGVAEPVRVRFTHVTDEHIAGLVRDYTPGTITVTATSTRINGYDPALTDHPMLTDVSDVVPHALDGDAA
ncbi:S-DNA-T family DNA segregation ATPase FtsK/SpoIIIE [Jatrophihabitans sp. GAS493]|uniref:FtsK/SpoIIIE domain-containing protein n=1 Tax=Jatrophihabitans sp. GAS493 TaxID=1907575 RepID=UPI000BB7F14E|nr:FtsK/SpoIIIE domain-containing protein [Jatrophihabitans sp. GAS493]SOD73283.1 S-DNA-T family DNA segregation ATPase FtsK/SpoIIIE [Jatrophihabitans sp. GAS493]